MMNVLDFLKLLDFDNFNYFYHETEPGVGLEIMENGLLVDGTNILGVDNIAYTTTLPLEKDLVNDPQEFVDFLKQEKSSNPSRKVAEMVILCSTKEIGDRIVESYQDYCNGNYYEGIINNHLIMGVIDLETLEFTMNEEFEYAEELMEDNDYCI